MLKNTQGKEGNLREAKIKQRTEHLKGFWKTEEMEIIRREQFWGMK